MKKFCLSAVLLSAALFALPEMEPGVDFTLEQTTPENIIINNRVLLKVGGKHITVMDVVRKMDLLFYQQYPELKDSIAARYQFYISSWRPILSAVIDDQLILADAKDKKVDTNDGEVREAMEGVFGRDPVLALDSFGLTYDEAFEMFKTDLIVQKMTGGMVHSKAMTGVNPKKMWQLYDKMRKDHPPQDRFIYRVLSFRSNSEKKAKDLALEAHRLIDQGSFSLEMISEQLGNDEIEIILSQEYARTAKEISNSHKAVLTTLEAGGLSAPIIRKGVVYLFALQAMEKDELPPFHEMEDELKNRVMQSEYIEYNKKYRNDLREKYGFTEKELSKFIPGDLKPFAFR
ncbi:MAG: hypothetical protein ACKVOH_01955 [Chlamydiales bacterium]